MVRILPTWMTRETLPGIFNKEDDDYIIVELQGGNLMTKLAKFLTGWWNK
ncbi:hypothetical protein [Candidatus Neptunichlamydia sp. REUL1]|nr:hypothetical protein [Candidatus Neptunochlamydia sp. REUL1]